MACVEMSSTYTLNVEMPQQPARLVTRIKTNAALDYNLKHLTSNSCFFHNIVNKLPRESNLLTPN